ncbi:hypothetical protein QE152_g40320 [Popillia japonica]|uniref:Uncharacterized protein n=1 Tax=Popillia japonica TaxID=7064 RepID=A0AAW1HR84_POPJA
MCEANIPEELIQTHSAFKPVQFYCEQCNEELKPCNSALKKHFYEEGRSHTSDKKCSRCDHPLYSYRLRCSKGNEEKYWHQCEKLLGALVDRLK